MNSTQGQPSCEREPARRLLSAAARRGIETHVAAYRATASSFYLECRLAGENYARVDLLASFLAPFAAPGARDERRGRLGTRASTAGEDLLRSLETARRDRASALHQLGVAWLEFDDMRLPGLREPNACVCVAPSYSRPFSPQLPLPAPSLLKLLGEALEKLLQRRPSRRETTLFRRVTEALPPGAAWIHFSVMRARAPEQLKLYGVFPDHRLLPYLHAIGWPGDHRALERLLDRYCPPERTGGMLYVDLPLSDFDEPRGAGLGISLSQQQLYRAREKDPERRPLLRALAADGLCTLERIEELRGWLREPAAPGAAQRFLDIKLVQPPRGAPFAKAYLGFPS